MATILEAPMQDDDASTAVVDVSPTEFGGVLFGGANTEDISNTGPGDPLNKSLLMPLDETVYMAIGRTGVTQGSLQIVLKLTANTGSHIILEEDIGPSGAFTINADAMTLTLSTLVNQSAMVFDLPEGLDLLEFHRYTAFWDGNEGTLYVDGEEADTATAPTVTEGDFTDPGFYFTTLGATGGDPFYVCGLVVTDTAALPLAAPLSIIAPGTRRGIGVVGKEIVGNNGQFVGNPTPSVARQWIRYDDDAGMNPATIDGATNADYTPVSADIGKYIRRRDTGTNSEGSAVAYTLYIKCYAAASPTITPVDGELDSLSAFDGKLLLTQTLNDVASETLPGTLTYKDEAPQNGFDWSAVAVGVEGETGSGATLIGTKHAIMAKHAGNVAGHTVTFLTPAGSQVEATIAETFALGGANNDAQLVRFTSAPAGIDSLPILADSSILDSQQMLGVENNRHLNLLDVDAGASNSNDTIAFSPTSADIIEQWDSGKPCVVLYGGELVAVGAFYTASLISNIAAYIPEIAAAMAGESDTGLVTVTDVVESPPGGASGLSLGLGLTLK